MCCVHVQAVVNIAHTAKACIRACASRAQQRHHLLRTTSGASTSPLVLDMHVDILLPGGFDCWLDLASGMMHTHGIAHPQGSSWRLQENTVVQTCVVASYSLAFAGGFGCYLLSMDSQTFTNLGPIAGNRPQVSI